MKTAEQVLAEQPFFKGLDARYLRLCVGCATSVYYEAGAYIFREGEQAENFYLITQGRVALETVAAQRGSVLIETIEAGEALGWSWLFPPYRWHFAARAVEPVQAIVFDGPCLRTIADKDHDFGYELVKRVTAIITERLQATRLRLLDMYGNPQRGAV